MRCCWRLSLLFGQSLTEELKQESEPRACLALFLSLLIIREFGVVPLLPGKLFLPAIKSLSQKMDESLSERLVSPNLSLTYKHL